jgi:RNA polymerase sigma-32 factor
MSYAPSLSLSASLPALTGESGLSDYIERVNQFPYLSEDEERSLATRLQEDKDLHAAHALVTSHLRLVVKVAMSFRGYGLPLLEVISEGNLGLMQAVKKFDVNQGFRLSTYAMWWIRASIQEYILRSWSLVKIGTTAAQKKLFFNLRKMKNRLQKLDDSQLSVDDVKHIAHELNVSEKDVTQMDQRLTGHDQSLNAPIFHEGEESGEYIDFLPSTEVSHDDAMANDDELSYKRTLLSKALKTLNSRERSIFLRRKMEEPAVTLEELSQEFDISRERVRQIEKRVMEKVTAFVTNERPKSLPAA